MPKPVELR